MVKVTLLKSKQNAICGFEVKGHAGFAEEGEDIVCAAVTILLFNTMNSIEVFTKEQMDVTETKDGGYLKCILPNILQGNHSNADVALLLNAMELGLTTVSQEYKKHINIRIKEV